MPTEESSGPATVPGPGVTSNGNSAGSQEAARRDDAARARDAAAAERDQAAAAGERSQPPMLPATKVEERLELALEALGETRNRATLDRARAREDREAAARDRNAAATDREMLEAEIAALHRDPLTDAYLRRAGEVLLAAQVEHSHRTGTPLTLAFIDVDGLKATNDRDGHAAGDSLLFDVAQGLRGALRPTDPLVRWGGDEFLCTMANTNIAIANQRLGAVEARIAEDHRDAGFGIGLAERTDGDTARELIARANSDLLERRSQDRSR